MVRFNGHLRWRAAGAVVQLTYSNYVVAADGFTGSRRPCYHGGHPLPLQCTD